MVQSKGFSAFALIWFGQLVSLIGSAASAFAFGIWIYERTGSVTEFALVTLLYTVPNIVLSPLAGSLSDRWDRRWLMILSDGGAGLSTLALAALLFTGQLQPWHIYLGILIGATFGAFQWPAYSAAVTLLVPKEQLGRASGMMQIPYAAGQLVAPILAGVLYAPLGLRGIVLFDSVTFLVALLTLLIVRIPRPATTDEGARARGSLLHEAAFGWRYIGARPGLLALLLLSVVANFCLGSVEVLIAPMILSFASEAALGTVLSISGSGMLAGSIVMGLWGGLRRRTYGVLLFMALQGLVLMIGGLRASVTLIGAAAFAFLFFAPLIGGANQAIWQSKVEPDVQGRVLAARSSAIWAALPLAYLLAGPLADQVFRPLLLENGPLAASVGQLIGVGPGRGIALQIILYGALLILTALIGYSYPRLRVIENELLDITPTQPAPQVLERAGEGVNG